LTRAHIVGLCITLQNKLWTLKPVPLHFIHCSPLIMD
jgi:hypothetical protein